MVLLKDKIRRSFSVSNVTSVLLAMVFAFATVLATGARASDEIPGEYLVKYKDNATVAAFSMRSMPGLRLASHNPFGRIYKVILKPELEARALASLEKDPNVEYVVPNIRLHMFEAPVSTETLKDQWSMDKIHAKEAWNRAGNKGSRNVVVAVIDTGVDYNHESLKANMIPGYDFAENDEDPMDKTESGGNPGHGTHCAGVIGATGLVDGGIVGLSPDVSIMPLRFLNEKGSGDLNAGIKSIDYAIQKKAHIISASWGASISESRARPLIEAVKRASDAGIIFVVAAANDGANNDTKDVYPANASFSNTIAVAASDKSDAKPYWSNYGKKKVHIASPGDAIMSTLPGNTYGNLSGTSMATPLVAGLVAFLKAQDMNLNGEQIRSLMQLTGPKVSIETACNCRIDALASVDALLSKKMFISPATAALKNGETVSFKGNFGQAPFKFEVLDSKVGTIDADGKFTASGQGTTQVKVTDAAGNTSTSLDIMVGAGSSSPGAPSEPGGPGPSPAPGECPFGDAATCEMICKFQPDLPFCKH